MEESQKRNPWGINLNSWLPLAIVLVLTAVLYAPSLTNGFVNLDDTSLLLENPWVQSISLTNIVHAFTSFDPELYIPLTFMSYMSEYAMFGLHATGYHAVSLLLHLINVTLLYGVLRKLKVHPISALITVGLFALHPINAETVLWVSARKDLLSSAFMFGSLLKYLDEEEHHKRHRMSLALFSCALLAKVMAATLPFVLLMIAWYQRKSLYETLLRIWPFFLLSAVFIVIAAIGKTHILDETTFIEKVLMAPQSIMLYAEKLLVPLDLSVVYHTEIRPSLSDSTTVYSLFFVIICAVTLFFLRKHRGVLTLASFSLLTLAPTFLNFAKGGSLFTGSDRYMYIPAIGLFLLIALVIVRSMANLSHRRTHILGVSMILGVLAFWIPIVQARITVFSTSIRFNEDIIEKAPHEYRAYNNLGVALEDAGRFPDAITQYARAIAINPTFADSSINRATLQAKLGDTTGAEASLLSYLQYGKENPKALYTLGLLYKNANRCKEAIPLYDRAIAALPEFPLAHRDIALCLGKEKRYKEAIEHFKILKDIDPDFRANLEEGDLLQKL